MGATSISWPQVAAFRLHRHHLDRPANRNQIVDVVRDVGGVQAQLPTAAALALRTRVRGLTMDDIERALWRDRTLVKAWSMRGALHLLPASDFLIYNRGLLKRAERSMRWMARYGLSDKDADAMVASIVEALRDGPLTRRELAKRVVAALGEKARPWVEHSWGGVVHRAALFGHVVFGPDEGNEITFVLREKWLRGVRDISPEDAEAELVRTYLRGYGPAAVQDFAAWADIAVAVANPIFEVLRDELAPIVVEAKTLWALRKDMRTLRGARLASPVVRLLPNFDTYLLGHDRKNHLVDAAHYKRVYRKAGWLSPVVLVDGRAAGVWSHERRGNRLAIRVEPFRKLARTIRDRVEAEAQDVGRFLEMSPEISFASE